MPLRCRERCTHGAKLVAKLKLVAPTRATPRIAPHASFFFLARLTSDV
jgi:hypothetical protein